MHISVASIGVELPPEPHPKPVVEARKRCDAVHRQFGLDRAALKDAESALAAAQGAANEALVQQKLGAKPDTSSPAKVAQCEAAVTEAKLNVEACEAAARRCVDGLLAAVVDVAGSWRADLEQRHRADVARAHEAVTVVRQAVADVHAQKAAISWLARLDASGVAMRPTGRGSFVLARPLIAASAPPALMRAVDDLDDALDRLAVELHAEPEPAPVGDVVRV